ncbi:hypothetical protein LSAT2_011326 [Lamellibrachia satsuma]|nr:hypothetical protein LSAT2_011326 [Lamellibrachia satsuma]
MKELEVELVELKLLVVAMVGREQGGCTISSGGGTVDDKVGKYTRYARESSPQPGRKLRGVKVTGRRETGRRGKEKGVGETGGKTTGVKERGVGETRAKEWEVGETGGKWSGQNVMEVIERKSYSAAVIEGVRNRAMVFVWDSIVRKTDRGLNKGDDVVVCLPGAKIEAITERVVPLEIFVDNIDVDVVTGHLWVAGNTDANMALNYLTPPHTARSPSQVLRLTLSEDSKVTDVAVVYYNDGRQFSGASVAVHYRRHMLVGSAYTKMLLCQVHRA